MAGASRLGTYNKALRHVGERPLASLNENREPLRLLNREWDDAIDFTLRAGYWNFAKRLVRMTHDINQSPQFGYKYCYTKPEDWISTYQLADNTQFDPLLRWYADQNNVIYANIDPIYLKYISSDANFGRNLSLWTPGYIEYLAVYLAYCIAPRITGQNETTINRIEKRMRRTKDEAVAAEAMDLPPGKPPVGTWVQSRAPRGGVYQWGGSGSDD